MSELLLARIQFATTSTYHWLFVPLTLGMTIMIAVMQTMYVRSGNETYKRMAKFWGQLFLINFAMGVVTGIVQEFHFGMNWSEYSRFMGDIFGAPLALEALTAFFLESTFIGLWIFGWDRLSSKAHMIVAWLVAIGSNLSAFWILVANSFMQHPVGYALQNGRAEMIDFGALVTNSYVLHQFPHVISSGLSTAGMVIMAVSAYHYLKKTDMEFFSKSMKVGIAASCLGLLLVVATGHSQAQFMATANPMKLASMEALWETQNPAPFSLFAVIDEQKKQNSTEITVPAMLSFLVYNVPAGEVKGLNEMQAQAEKKYGPGDYTPPVTPIYWAFRLMAGLGTLMLLASLAAAYLYKKGKLAENTAMLKFLLYSAPFPYIINSCGWFVTEAGRQPWIVFGMQRTAEGVSVAVSAGQIMISLVGFTLVYALLAIVAFRLALKHIKQGPVDQPKTTTVQTGKGASVWN